MSEYKLQVRERDGGFQFGLRKGGWVNATRLFERLLCRAVLERDEEVERLRKIVDKKPDTGNCSTCDHFMGHGCRFGEDTKRASCYRHTLAKVGSFGELCAEITTLKATLAAKEQTLRTVEDECAALRAELSKARDMLMDGASMLLAARAEREGRVTVEADAYDLLVRYHNNTPLGHQPHMIAMEADEWIAAYLARAKPEQADSDGKDGEG